MARNTIFVVAAAVALLFAAVCVGFASAAAPLARSAPSDQDRVYDFTISESKDLVSWTAYGREWIVRLELSDVVEDNTDYYLGTLEGDESAVVSFALLPGMSLSGMIATSETTWWIRSMPVIERNLSEEEADLGVFMVREQGSLSANALPEFAAPLQADVELDNEVDTQVDADADLEAGSRKRAVTTYKVGILFDQKWATASNNPWASRADTLALFNDINAIYKAAGLGQFKAVYLKQVTNDQTSLNSMLSYFANTASANIAAMKDTTYTNYVWLVGSNVGGLAYVGTSCGRAAQKQKTAVAGLVNFSRLWTVKTIAHELAHNRGASHEFDNACSNTVKTNCQCSVMSYCFPSANNNPQGAVNFFSTTSIAKMKATGCY